MKVYDVQITTDLNETVVLQVTANGPREAEMEAMSLVEGGCVDTLQSTVWLTASWCEGVHFWKRRCRH